MRQLYWRGGSLDRPCKEYEKLKLVAEELLATVSDTTSPEQFEQAQKSLLLLWQELQERLDPLHFRTPGGHRCLEDAYLHYAMVLKNRAILQPPPPQPPAPRSPLETPQQVVEELNELIQHRTDETMLGQDTKDTA